MPEAKSSLLESQGLDDAGFEVEDYGESEPINNDIEPFDPKKVDVGVSTPNLGALITRLKHDEIDLLPDFQRSGDLWTKKEQSRLVESILIRLPIPAFYFDAVDEDRWQVVDGLQRLSTIRNFVIQKKLQLTDLEFLTDYEGFNYDQLSRPLQRRIDEFQVTVYLIKPGTPFLMKYSLFNRINTGGLKLKPQEIRHAMSQSKNNGAASRFLRDTVKSKEFLTVVTNKNYRMYHEELALRYFSFVLFGLDSYKSSLPRFLNSGMDELGQLDNRKLEILKSNFLKSMELAYSIFSEDAFKKTLAEPGHKKVVNKPLFEVVSVCLSELSQNDQELLLLNKGSLLESFGKLLINEKFSSSISKSTANTDNVQVRFQMVRDAIKAIIERSKG